MILDVVFLSRLQFALTIMFHYLFPPLTIGMSIVLVYLETMYFFTREQVYETAARFWTQLFAVSFAVGVATGIVMEFQFGTNWAIYSRFVGDVFGSALAAEGIFAFFLESGFLSVLVFGWDKVSAGFHLFATIMVAIGSVFSAVWILIANSWQQTPAGHRIVQMMRDGKPWFVDGKPIMRAEVVDFWAMVFNPSMIDRLVHTLIAAFLMGAFFVMSISAFYLLKKRHEEFARRSFTGALLLATIFSLAQLVSGHSNARMVSREQPAKLAAFEAHYVSGPADLYLFGLPTPDGNKVNFGVKIPGALSFLIHGNRSESVIGLDRIHPQDRPSILICFSSYHLMVGIGMFFIFLTCLALYFRIRGSLFEKRWLLWIFVGSVVLAVAGNQLGWVSAEAGRQPWTVYPSLVKDASGQPVLDKDGFLVAKADEGLRTKDAVSEVVHSGQVVRSILMFGAIYALLGIFWIYVLNHKIEKGPPPFSSPPDSARNPLLATGPTPRKRLSEGDES